MSDVVLRCPHCGTTQARPGECEACHEADVRFFCENHVPPLWLDGPVCATCGARVVDERTARERAARERAEAERRARARGARDAARPPDPPPRTPPRAPPGGPRRTTLEDLLRARAERAVARAAERARARATPPEVPRERLRDFEVVERDTPVPGGTPRGWPVGRGRSSGVPGLPLLGCLGRLFALAVVVVVVLALGTCWVLAGGGGGIPAWVVDAGQQVGVIEGVPAQTQRGVAALRAGDVATAERELAEAARSYPRSGRALVYLARIRLDAGDEYRAREYLREAIAREPDDALAYRELAGVHLRRAQRAASGAGEDAVASEELALAERYYGRAVDLDPTDRGAQGFYACVLAALDRPDDAAAARAAAGTGPWDACRIAADGTAPDQGEEALRERR